WSRSRRESRTAGGGEKDQFPPRQLSARCGVGQGPLAGTRGDERGAPFKEPARGGGGGVGGGRSSGGGGAGRRDGRGRGSAAAKVQQPSARESPMTSDGSPRPISPLRARMIEDMTVRGFSEKTRHDYVRKVRAFAAFIGRSPDAATAEDLRLFQLHQTQSGMQPPSINSAVSALRFFFTATLDRPDLARRLTIVPYPRRIPAVLSVEEVTLLLQAASAPKYKAAFALAYGAGLRVSEVVALKVGDIDSKRMLLRVERGKGGKDRHAMLSP